MEPMLDPSNPKHVPPGYTVEKIHPGNRQCWKMLLSFVEFSFLDLMEKTWKKLIPLTESSEFYQIYQFTLFSSTPKAGGDLFRRNVGFAHLSSCWWTLFHPVAPHGPNFWVQKSGDFHHPPVGMVRFTRRKKMGFPLPSPKNWWVDLPDFWLPSTLYVYG